MCAERGAAHTHRGRWGGGGPVPDETDSMSMHGLSCLLFRLQNLSGAPRCAAIQKSPFLLIPVCLDNTGGGIWLQTRFFFEKV